MTWPQTTNWRVLGFFGISTAVILPSVIHANDQPKAPPPSTSEEWISDLPALPTNRLPAAAKSPQVDSPYAGDASRATKKVWMSALPPIDKAQANWPLDQRAVDAKSQKADDRRAEDSLSTTKKEWMSALPQNDRSQANRPTDQRVVEAAKSTAHDQENNGLVIQLPDKGLDVPAPSQGTTSNGEEDYGEELILQLRLDRLVLADAVFALKRGSKLYLGLAEIAVALEFPIDVFDDGRRAEGWFMKENRLFAVDLAARSAHVAGEDSEFAEVDAFAEAGDLYVSSELLQQWWPIDLELDLSTLSLTVISRERLPVERKLEREERRSRVRDHAAEEAPLPRFDLPYRLISIPVLDLSLRANGQLRDDSGFDNQESWSAIAAGDMAGLNGQLFVAGNNETPLDTLRVTLGRQEPEGGLLGPFGATSFELFDVVSPGRALIASPSAGRGMVVTNRPLDRASEFDRVTLQGDLPPGWEVELHINGALRDFRIADEAGLYGFEDVGLVVGQNELRLVFYGPEGQQREEVRRILVGPGAVEPGRLQYRFSVTEDGRAVVDVDRERVRRTNADAGLRAFGEVEYGVTRDLSASFAAAHLPLAEQARSFASIGLLGQKAGVLGRSELALDSRGGLAWLLGSQSRIGPIAFFAEHAQFGQDFQSDEAGTGDLRLASLSQARVNTNFRTDSLPPLSLGTIILFEKEVQGRDTTTVQAQAASLLGRMAVASEASVIEQRGASLVDNRRIDGSVRLSGAPNLPGRPFLRANFDYGISPVLEADRLDFSADFGLADSGNLRFGIGQDLQDETERRWSIDYSRQFERLRLGVGADYDEAGDAFFRVSLGLSLMRDPSSGWPVVVADRLSSNGAAVPQVFLDHDLDGVFGIKDEPIANAEFTLAGRQLDGTTDDTGHAILTGLSPYRPGNLSIREGSLEDPYWVPTKEGYGIVSRPGVVPVLAFPIVMTGEVDGIVEVERDGDTSPAANVALQLVEADAKIAYEVRSAYDGFYLFEKVLPGRYTLRVNPDQLERLGLLSNESEIELSGDGDIISGLNILLETIVDDAPRPQTHK